MPPAPCRYERRARPADGTSANAELLGLVQRWFEDLHADKLVSLRAGRTHEAMLVLRLHPADAGVRLRIDEAGALVAQADTFPVGPGFAVFLGRALRNLGRALDLAWDQRPMVGPQVASEEAQARLMTEARALIDRLGETERFPGFMLAEGHRFAHQSLVATPLGPRDMRWLAGAAVGALPHVEVFPWPQPGQRGRYFRGRALVMLWTQVRWRPPRTPAERQLLEAVDTLLDQAWHAEPNLDLPWEAWAEVHTLLARDDEQAREVARRAAQQTTFPPVGYRRRPVQVRLPGGWWTQVPGDMSDGEVGAQLWRASTAGRSIQIEVHTGPRARGLEGRPGEDDATVLVHRGPDLAGTARFRDTPGAAQPAVLEGLMRAPDTTAVLTARFSDPGDRSWAVDAWRALRLEHARRAVE